MKKFTFCLIALFAVLSSFTASADISFKIIVDNADAVNCSIGYDETQVLSAGENNMTAPSKWSQVMLESISPFCITKVTDMEDTPLNLRAGQSLFYPDDGGIYTVTTVNLDEQRDASCTIIVDDPSLVAASLSETEAVVNLEEGSNTVKFMSDKENHLRINSANWQKPIYQVHLGDELQTPQQYSEYEYDIPLTNGCTVTITARIPEVDVTMTFEYTDEQSKGAITSVTIDGEPVTDFDGTSVTMKTGHAFGFSINPDYNLDKILIDGKEQSYFYGSYSNDCVTAAQTFTITAHPYGMVNYTVDIDDPENIIFREGNAYSGTVLTLNAGENKLQISEKNTAVSWAAADGAYFTSQLYNGAERTSAYVNIKEGDKIVLRSAKINFDKTAVVWIDDMTNVGEGSGSFTLTTGSTGDRKGLTAGYNEIPFYDAMVPFSISATCYANGVTLVHKYYLDGTALTPEFPFASSPNYARLQDIAVADNSVLKVFLTEQPVNCNVTFNAPEGLEATVTYDRVKTLGKLADGLACFKGTEVAIEGADDLTVKVGETELEKNNDGKFVFTVADPATTVTLADKSSGVENVVIATEADASAAVYTLMGVRVGTRAQLSTLPAGIYVLNGQKIIVK